MKQPTDLLRGRRLYLACALGVLALAVLFTLVGLLGPGTGSTGVVPDDQTGIEVDIDVDHPRAHPRHSPQQRQRQASPAPRKAPAARSTPVRKS